MTTGIALPGCPSYLSAICTPVGAVGSGVASTGASAVLSAVTGWIVTAASWLLGQIGAVMSATTQVQLTTGWFGAHYRVMAGIGMVVVLPMLLFAAVQAVFQQNPGVLVRSAFVQLPLAALLAGAAIQLVQLSLVATDALCSTVGAGAGLTQVLTGLSSALTSQAAAGPGSAPMFVVVVGALLVAAGAFSLWIELLVRAAAVYVAVLFLPLGLASLVWPTVSHWCRRLVETLVALVLSKFVIVAVLSLAVGALGSGTSSGFSAVLAGGALLLLAAFAPFVLLRMVPVVEGGAVHQLEGARHRIRQAVGSMPESAVAHVLRAASEGRQPSLEVGSPGTGQAALAMSSYVPGGPAGGEGEGDGPPGPAGGPGGTGGTGPAGERSGAGGTGPPTDRGTSGGSAIPELPGDPASNRAFWEVMNSADTPVTPMRGTGGILPGATALPLWSTPPSPETEGPETADDVEPAPGPGPALPPGGFT